MKTFITSFNQKLGVNPMVGRILDAIPGVVRTPLKDCDVIFYLFIAPESDFELDKVTLEEAKRRDVPVIVFDYTETFPTGFVISANKLSASRYEPISQWLFTARVAAYFMREMPAQWTTYPTVPYKIYPIDWAISDQPEPPIDTPDQFAARPIDIFMSWGYSNESRPKLMGELLRQAGKFCAHFCLTDEDLSRALHEKRERIFALLYTPHYRRIPLTELLFWQQRSKISISMFGAGKKCFRCAEASYNCVMAQQAPQLVEWSYRWAREVNCIALDATSEEHSVDLLYQALRVYQGDLHPIYLAGMANNRKYHNTAYARDYLLPKIQEALK